MIDVPETLPIPITPDDAKGVAPGAVKRSHPPFHDPRKEGEAPPRREKERKRSRKATGDDDAQSEDRTNDDARGTRIDVRA